MPSQVAGFYVLEHLIQFGRRKVLLSRLLNGADFLISIPERLPMILVNQSAPYPCGHGELLRVRGPLDFPIFGIVESDVESSGHDEGYESLVKMSQMSSARTLAP